MKSRTMLTLYSAAHFFVDFCCAFGMFSIVKPAGNWMLALLFYNFCAFALQMPLGIIIDSIHHERAFAAIGCVFVFGGLLFSSPLWCSIILGIGNALFHIGAGSAVLKTFNKCTPLGIFVSPGALGLYFGTLLGSTSHMPKLVCLLILAVCFVTIVFFCKNEKKTQSVNVIASERRFLIFACVCLFAVVFIRSYAGMNFSFPWKAGVLSFAVTAAAATGKTLGGVFYDKLGGKMTTFLSLAMSAVFLLFSKYAVFGIVGVLMFNFTMPITLYELTERMPEKKGFAFGMLTFALFIGFLPSLFGAEMLNGVMSCVMAAISLLLLLPFAGGNKQCL